MAAVVSGTDQQALRHDRVAKDPAVRSPHRIYEILVVDPDPDTASEVKVAMPDALVRRAQDTYCALYDVGSARVDLIVAELRLPGAGAVELLQRLRARGFRVPVVVLSHARGSASALRALGVSAVLAKPVSTELLHDTLQLACKISSRHMRVLR